MNVLVPPVTMVALVMMPSMVSIVCAFRATGVTSVKSTIMNAAVTHVAEGSVLMVSMTTNVCVRLVTQDRTVRLMWMSVCHHPAKMEVNLF